MDRQERWTAMKEQYNRHSSLFPTVFVPKKTEMVLSNNQFFDKFSLPTAAATGNDVSTSKTQAIWQMELLNYQ